MFGNTKKLASLEARHNNLESRFNQALELIDVQKAQIESQQATITQLITSQLDYSKLSTAIVEELDYEPLKEAVQEYLSDYDFDYDEIASNLEDAVSERVVNDVNWNDVVESFANDIVGDDYSKLVQLITDQLDVSDAVENAVNNDLDFDSAITDWLDSNGEELIANNLDTRAVFDALRNDLDCDEASSRDLVETLMTAFNSYNDWRVENGYDVISIGSSDELPNLESLGSQIKAFIENETVTSSEDAVGDYTALEWQVLMLIRKAVLEILS